MKSKIAFALISTAFLFGENSFAETSPCGPELRKKAISEGKTMQKKLPGSHTEVNLVRCELIFNNNELYAEAEYRMHIKDRNCIDKPWPAEGKWCADTYNYWANAVVNSTFDLNLCMAVPGNTRTWITGGASPIDKFTGGMMNVMAFHANAFAFTGTTILRTQGELNSQWASIMDPTGASNLDRRLQQCAENF